MKFKIEDCEIFAGRCQNKGGQYVSPSFGVTVIHVPTGIQAYCDYSYSQRENREACIKMVKAGAGHLLEKPGSIKLKF